MRQSSKAVAALVFVAALVPSVPFARDRPGTPNDVRVEALSSTSLRITFRTTCSFASGV